MIMELQDDTHNEEQASQHNSLLTDFLGRRGTLAQQQEQFSEQEYTSCALHHSIALPHTNMLGQVSETAG